MRNSNRRSLPALIASGLVALFAIASSTPASATASEVACRTNSTSAGSSQLTLHWDGTTAKGTLEHTAPSGSVTTTTVRAERVDGMIVADDVFETDLVSHAAVIRVVQGKKMMRVEGDAPWLACE